ncbi:mitochondrial ATPase expression domain-containing protein [Hirsutella rhossiliensis]|uniref:Mitochondrial ATPase expression domain-containing protein n=1 Tax=Hirsutella rhossiliensis TaxID=111463 RepID=A0A9P8MUH5_9HYPO|nr:mitochondrial ATPase expression domain-containing protein [Hirsutella rhossiliensis]KAH0961389.1 mitochondrial ATPase expression domain-containing protein [Hirsutella rhossiliensis]
MLFRGPLLRPGRLPPRLRRRPSPTSRNATGGPSSSGKSWPQSLHDSFPLARDPPLGGALESVLDAVRTNNTGQLLKAFIAWTSVLRRHTLPTHDAAVREVQQLPATAVSEIVRSLDPVLNPHLDVAHGLTIGSGETQFTPAASLVDEFGVRTHHGEVLLGMQALLRARARQPLAPADYEVMMRCAGAGVDRLSGKRFWTAMTDSGLQDWRTSRTWVEFLKGRFMTEPLYYQFDRTRALTLPRDLHREMKPLSLGTVKRLDRIRLGLNALSHHPWNRDPAQPERDWRRLLRKRIGYGSFVKHFYRMIGYGYAVSEEFLCASMVAFSRCGRQNDICTLILEGHYGIRVVRNQELFRWDVEGGNDLPADSPIRPTARLLDAVVDAFGALCNLPLGLDLVQHISQRYSLPIPPETWSNLLRWAYINASAPYRHMREAEPHRDLRPASIRDPLHVWRTMTSEPYNVEPSFDDHCCHVKMLIRIRSFAPAIDTIRNQLVPRYKLLDDEYHKAVLDELLVNDTALTPRPATHRRRQAEVHKDHARYHIARCLHMLLKTASQNAAHRRGRVMRVLVPNLLAEFAEFFPHYVSYRTANGLAVIRRDGAPRRFDWVRAWRTTLPANLCSGHLDEDGSVDSSQWPRAEDMRVLGWQRVPRPRRKILGRAPVPKDKAVVTDATDVSKVTSADYTLRHEGIMWFKRLERELMM